ncbi:docking protein 1 [Hoplias malabaricus]|uniref:docking protein 1 n=1 Tax=Hoplias malabaricus TaxID=27720 RepID=UPI0034629579
MDALVKRGEVYLQHHKHSEKWKRYWLNLYADSRQGVARLELTDTSIDRSPVMVRRQPERKVVRLSDCISVVRLPPHAEAHPGENMAAFCVETEEKKLVFAVGKDGCGEWVEKICDTAFPKASCNLQRQPPPMEENQIYASREEVFEFWVTVQQSEASVRCGLKGSYWLQVGENSLIIKDNETRQRVMEWPYKLLRRYGRDKTMFSIEAGRRCDSGPGAFHLETKQSEEILRMVELSIHQQKSLGIPVGACSPHSPSSPLPRRPISASLLDTLTNSSSDSDFSSPVGSLRSSSTFESACASPLAGLFTTMQRNPGDSACLPEPVYSTLVNLTCTQEAVYSQPNDAIRLQQTVKLRRPNHLHNDKLEPVYADPIDVLRPKPEPKNLVCSSPVDICKLPIIMKSAYHCHQSEPVYAEVFNTTNSEFCDHTKEEPIYSLPILSTTPTGSGKECKLNAENKKVDENTVIYSQVKKAGKSTKSQTNTTDIISENLGLI